MQCTIEKMNALQRLQVTLHHRASGEDAAFTPLCSVSNEYPSKPILHIRKPTASHTNGGGDAGDAAAASSAPHESVIDLALNVRINLADGAKNHVTQAADATILSLGITADLAEPESEDDFPTSRELMPSEYAQMYCRACGADVFAPRRQEQKPRTIHSLPSPYWTEMTDLWFCHSGDNAHIDRIAATKIVPVPGKILVDQLLLRVHRTDVVAQGEAWRRHASVRKVMKSLADIAHTAANASTAPSSDESMSDVPPSSTDAAAAAAAVVPRDIWSPLPCTSCDAIIGSILLTLIPSLDPAEAIRPNDALNEVRLFKFRLSNCFRKRPTTTTTTAPTTPTNDREEKAESMHPTASAQSGQESNVQHATMMDGDAAMSASNAAIAAPVAASAPSALVPSTPALSSCLCSTYAPSPQLTCSNLYMCYTFENFLAADLAQRHARQPIGKFLIECNEEEDEEDAEGMEDDTGSSSSSSSHRKKSHPLVRLFVTQWAMPMSSNIGDAFPYTPQFGASNAMVPVIKLEYAVHEREDEPALQQWIYGKKKRRPPAAAAAAKPATDAAAAHASCGDHHHGGCSHSASSAGTSTAAAATVDPHAATPFPSNLDRLSYSAADLRALLVILRARSRLWPASLRVGMVDPGMQKSCLVQLSKHIKPTAHTAAAASGASG